MSDEVRSANAPGPGPTFTLPEVDPTSHREFSLPSDLLASLLADGDEELVTWTLTEAIAERGRAATYDELLTGAMALVGERWIAGQWGIAEEHLASRTILQVLDAVRPMVALEPDAPLAVLAGVAGEHHSVGLICLSHILSEGGWSVANIGVDVPGAEIARYALRQEAQLVAVTAALEDRLPEVRAAVTSVRAGSSATWPAIILGGRLAADPRAAALDVDWAGSSLVAAATVIAKIRRSLSAPN